eukprot:scaffold4262_cov169-Amphora_coffeaeformis.AAC.7
MDIFKDAEEADDDASFGGEINHDATTRASRRANLSPSKRGCEREVWYGKASHRRDYCRRVPYKKMM